MQLKDESVADTVFTHTYHHRVGSIPGDATVYDWEAIADFPFNELVVSWNALRPKTGDFSVYISVEVNGRWSPYFLYSRWGASGQFGGDVVSEEFSLKIGQDILDLSNGQVAEKFRIRLEAEETGLLSNVKYLHACVSRSEAFHASQFLTADRAIDLKVPLISQFSLVHGRKRDMCSPTSTGSVVGYLKKSTKIDPVTFARGVHDDAHDIYGNWVLNIAHASDQLGEGWGCWVQRLSGFEQVYKSLCNQTPVVVSIKGELPGAPFAYPQGHLIVVKGYDPKTSKVSCMDPAFPSDAETSVHYSIDDFMKAWSRRRCLAYIFQNLSSIHFSKTLSSQ